MSPVPGKTAPRLVEDLLNYDLRLEARHGRNILTTLPPHYYEKDKDRPRAVPVGSCRHAFMIKSDQSTPPESGQSPDEKTVYVIASYCGECRYHLDFTVDFRGCDSKEGICPTAESPLHHFVHTPEIVQTWHLNSQEKNPHLCAFACSDPRCKASLWIRFRPPHLHKDFIDLMTDPEMLQARLVVAKEAFPERLDLEGAKPVQVLSYLHKYIQDSMNPKKNRKKIPMRNRLFMVSFGSDCDELLQYVGFTRNTGDDDAEEDCWYLPDVSSDEALKVRLDEVKDELSVLIHKRPSAELQTLRESLKDQLFTAIPSLQQMESALGCLDFPKTPSARRVVDYTKEEHPYYASLGALGSFSDELLVFAYDRQVLCDPGNTSYYFECLEDLAKGRQSESLEIKVMTLASQGQSNRRDIESAYKYFGIDTVSEKMFSDEHIIGLFKSRLSDMSPAEESSMRDMLRIIAQARKSDVIMQEASNSIETYQQALSWLNLEETTPDEFVVTMVTVKINESSSNAEIARRAVKIIAEKRNSDALRSWLNTGEIAQQEMDLAEAYQIFGIQDRTAKIDQTALRECYRFAVSDKSHPVERLDLAYTRILKENFGQPDDSDSERQVNTHPPESWPVGFQNIGNTCYLNSLLQFFFTVKPLRDLVLNFEDFKMDPESEEVKMKRVGGREITKEEIAKAQEFVSELQKLFQNMIVAPGSSVRPEVKLACLALKTLRAGDDNETGPPAEHRGDGLGAIGGLPVSGPMPPPSFQANLSSTDTLSEGTLVGDATPLTREPSEVANARPGVDLNQGIGADSPTIGAAAVNPFVGPPTPPDSDDDAKSISSTKAQTDMSQPPNRPPPIPPRPKPEEQGNTVPAEIEFAAKQQDVSEVINNIIFQLECAIRPEKLVDGEQWDLLKRLFYGEVSKSLFRKGKMEVKKELFDTLFVSVDSGPRHVYEALDEELDILDFDSESTEKATNGNVLMDTIRKYETITMAPLFLQINVRRVVYDSKTQRAVKVEHPLHLEKKIYLDRYLAKTKSVPEEELMRRREESWEWKRKLRACRDLEARLTTSDVGLPLADAVEAAADFISHSHGEPAADGDDATADARIGSESSIHSDKLADAMRQRAGEVREDAERAAQAGAELERRIEAQFEPLQDAAYALHSVFKHRGSAGGGHYFVYIYDFQRDLWRKYNDTLVDEVADEAEIFGQDERHPATSTSIFYVRDADRLRLTEAVHRKPPAAASAGAAEEAAREEAAAKEAATAAAVAGGGIEVEMKDAGPEFGKLEVINGEEVSMDG